MRNRFWYAFALLSGVTFSGIASAQQSGGGADEVLARLDRLEQQNAELRKTVMQRLPVVDPGTGDGSGDQQFISANGAPMDDEKMDAAVERYLKKQEAKKKAEAEAKKAAGYEVGSDRSAIGAWANDGLTFKSPNGDFSYHTRGLCQLDWVNIQNPADTIGVPGGAGSMDSTDFRRLRVGGEGTAWENMDFVWEVDFAFALQNVDPTGSAFVSTGLRSTATAPNVATQAGNVVGAPQPTTVFTTFKDIDYIGNLRIGNQQSWLSQEHIESARFTDFMERAVIMDAFNGPNNNGYQPGVSIFNTTENRRFAWQAGAYKTTAYDSGFTYDYGNGAYTYGGRICGTPYYDEASDGRYLLHLGLGGEFRAFNTELSNTASPLPAGNGNAFSSPYAGTFGDNIRIRVRGDVRNGPNTLNPNFADTGNFYATSQAVFDPELAFQWGSLLIQAEYEYCELNHAATRQGGQSLGAVNFNGGYVSCLYFLTGENRVYNRTSGVFGRVVPIENAFANKGGGARGKGAWQIGARYDWVDLNSGTNPLLHVLGGYNQNLTLGLNWFLNPNCRLQFNYVASWIDNPLNQTGANNGAAATGALLGSDFKGMGVINSLGTRLDFNF